MNGILVLCPLIRTFVKYMLMYATYILIFKVKGCLNLSNSNFW